MEDHFDRDACYRALSTRDPRFDGRLFVGVTSTGIYCRPVCPAPPPRREHCTFVASAAAAQAAGFRPCLRCRPESAPDSAAWAGTSTTVSRALRLIEEGALDEGGVETLAERLGVGSRHLRRLFQRHLGATPVAVAQTRRLLLAKQLLHQTDLPIIQVALASGFGSVRRFNEAFLSLYGRPPNALRGRRDGRAARSPELNLLLPYRPPYDWPAMLDFLGRRAIEGLERVEGGVYRRTLRLGDALGKAPGKASEKAPEKASGQAPGDEHGEVAVSHAPEAASLRVSIRLPRLAALPGVIARLRGLFDLQADPETIRRALERDATLAPLVRARPGLRVPGCWDTFEASVRAILGQQVSVLEATRLARRFVERLGDEVAGETPGLTRLFPLPERVVPDAVEALGVPGARAGALVRLAETYRREPRRFERSLSLDDTIGRLCALPGIGDWTAHYIAMRALGENDAFPAADAALRRVLAVDGVRPDARALRLRAEAWRPWRAYAVMHLWQADARASGAPSYEENDHATLS